MNLRPYQAQAVDQIRDAYRRGVRRPLYTAPTGSGKTVLFSYIARNAAARGKRVCILVHRRELLLQTCAKLETPCGKIAPGYSRTRDLIQVATVQTLVNRLDKYQFDLLVIDEAHHATASTWMRVITANHDARVLGVTATPCRMTGRGLGDVFDTLIVGPTVEDLTADGWLAQCEVYAPGVIDVSGVGTASGDYVKRDLAMAADRPTVTGCAIQHYRRYADGLPAIAFCVGVQHAEHVAAQFRAAGYMARRVDGGTPQADRDGAIAGLARGEIDVLTSCELISEGVDVPVVSCGIMLRPTKSLGLAMQQMGRILRPAPGKRSAIILDHAGNCLRHGLPDEPREWSLAEGAVRQKRGDTEAFPVRQCARCYYVHRPAPACPQCGYVYPIAERTPEEVAGELVRIEQRQKRVEVGRARDREALEAIARTRGYKHGWVEAILRARQAKREGAAAV